jgi:hypothetical protein
VRGDLTCDLPEENWNLEDKNTVYSRNALGVFEQMKDGAEVKIGLNGLVQEYAKHTLRIEYCSELF